MNKEERIKARQESDRHITVTTPEGKKLIDDGKVTKLGKKLLEEVEEMKIIETNEELEKIKNEGKGFIYNDFSGTGQSGKSWNILHKANCPELLYIAHITKDYDKYFFNTFQEAKNWLEQFRNPESVNWKKCGKCM